MLKFPMFSLLVLLLLPAAFLVTAGPGRAGPAPQQPWRPAALGDHGAVTAGHPLAAQIGLEVLRSGGNAVDAVVAMAGVLAVVRPHMNGVGGDAFMLIYSAGDDSVYALNGSGRAGRGADPAALARRGITRMPARGVEAITVPGAVDAWATAARRFGSRPLSGLLEPAIRLAVGGFPVSPTLRRDLAGSASLLRGNPALQEIYMPGGRLPEVGEMLVQSRLGATMREIASSGGESLYRGDLARRLAAYFQQEGGFVTAADLADHRSEWVQPIRTEYRGLQVYAQPPNSQGIALLQMLNIAGQFEIEQMSPGSADYWHLLIEAKKLAFADRDRFVADPSEAYRAPLEALLAPSYAGERARQIDPESAAALVQPGRPPHLEGDTVVCTAADIQGNMVVLIQSLFNAFGSAVVVGDTGIIMQNRGAGFSLEPDSPNRLFPGRRPYHTLCPSLVLLEGKPVLGLATPGGDGQAQTLVQVLNNWHLFGLDIQRAVEAPRFRSYDRVDVSIEEGVPAEVRLALESKGHRLRVVPTAQSADFGGAQGIVVLRHAGAPPIFMAGADPRREALALAW